ncbi:hypothetical protein QWU86_11525, partial [Neisseria gonorrhoeae]
KADPDQRDAFDARCASKEIYGFDRFVYPFVRFDELAGIDGVAGAGVVESEYCKSLVRETGGERADGLMQP